MIGIQNGKVDSDTFIDGIAALTRSIIANNKAPKPEFASLFADAKKPASEALGVCPRCGSPVCEGTKGFFSDSQTYGFKIWRESKFWTTKKKPIIAES